MSLHPRLENFHAQPEQLLEVSSRAAITSLKPDPKCARIAIFAAGEQDLEGSFTLRSRRLRFSAM
jgi:hypothetical protein